MEGLKTLESLILNRFRLSFLFFPISHELSRLEYLSEKEFSRMLKYTIEAQELEVIALELESRLKARKLQLQDIYLLLFQSGNEGFQQQAYNYLKDNVQDAASIISMATA
jgi:hypothetical protein